MWNQAPARPGWLWYEAAQVLAVGPQQIAEEDLGGGLSLKGADVTLATWLRQVLHIAYRRIGRKLFAARPMPELLSPVWELRREIDRHFCGMSRLLFFLRVSWVSLAGCGAGEEEVAFRGCCE